MFQTKSRRNIGNCDSTLFLGGKEPGTLKELSAALGKETIDSYNTGESRGREISHSLNNEPKKSYDPIEYIARLACNIPVPNFDARRSLP